MEEFTKRVSSFLNGPLQAHVLADVHHMRFETAERLDGLEQRLVSMKNGGGGRMEEAVEEVLMGGRGVIGDKWSMRILWLCAVGSAVSLYMVAVERQMQNRDRMLAESLKAAEAEGAGEDV